MASDQTIAIARVYAEALFELSVEQRLAEEVRDELQGIVAILETDLGNEFSVFLENPSISRVRKCAILSQIFKGRVSNLLENFLQDTF